jgi:hypothetical protein
MHNAMPDGAPPKILSKLSAKLESRKSPVSKDQDTVPMADAMCAFHPTRRASTSR